MKQKKEKEKKKRKKKRRWGWASGPNKCIKSIWYDDHMGQIEN